MDYLTPFINALNNHLQFDVNKRSFKNEKKLENSMAHFGQFENQLTAQYNDNNIKFICITLCHCDTNFNLPIRNIKILKALLVKIKQMDINKPIIILLEHRSTTDNRFYDLVKEASQSICHYPFPPKDDCQKEDLLTGSIQLFKNVIIEATRRNVLDGTKFS